MEKVYIIAEAGVNHNGSLEQALEMVYVAKEACADAIKFQTFIPEQGVTRYAMKAQYQIKATDTINESQLDMVRKLKLSFEEFSIIKKCCIDNGIQFLSTPFDIESISFLNTLGMDVWKIPSGEIINYPYLVKIAQTHKPIIMSTGMSTINEITEAVQVLRFHGSNSITLLHCTTEYPAPYAEVNLKAIHTLRNTFNLPVGYSDHTQGISIPIAAVAMGATVIEKHFTLDRNMKGPDHKASLEPNELKTMVQAIRDVEMAFGDGIKKPTISEINNIPIARKSIVALKPIRQGDKFSIDNITVKRPGTGISPMKWNEVIGQTAKRFFDEDELIEV